MQQDSTEYDADLNDTVVACITMSPKLFMAERCESCTVFMCRSCHAVLGDSLSLCGEEESLGVLSCLRVTEDVVVGDSLRFVVDGDLKGCAYYPLLCSSCGILIGFNLYSAFRTYAYLRGLFCLSKEHILCYVLKENTVLPANELHFEISSLEGHLSLLKKQLIQVHLKIEFLSNQLEQLQGRDAMNIN